MRKWNEPAIEELEISSTEYAQEEGTKADLWYVDDTVTPQLVKAHMYHGNSGTTGE